MGEDENNDSGEKHTWWFAIMTMRSGKSNWTVPSGIFFI